MELTNLEGLKIVINSLSAASLIGVKVCETFSVSLTAVGRMLLAAVVS